MKKIFLCLTLMLVSLPLALLAKSFKYNYHGVEFNVKVDGGSATIKGFDQDVAKVLIPANVKDKDGHSYPVSAVDLYAEIASYKTTFVAIEKGITSIEDYCFYCFNQLADIYIPASIEKIGKKAFNKKHLPKFTMPSIIDEKSLAAGLVVYPHAVGQTVQDPVGNIDLSAYVDDPSTVTAPVANNTVNEEQVLNTVTIQPGTSDIDYGIPVGNTKRENTFCLIIANEDYSKYNKDTKNVKYAAQDGKTFRDYCIRTLGIPAENVTIRLNADMATMNKEINALKLKSQVYGNDASYIVYYAGHGMPDEQGNCKLLPVNVSINDANTNGYPLKKIYSELGNLTTQSVLVLIDACFSGSDREDVALLDETHRGAVRRVTQERATGNVVVMTAASNTETSLGYDAKAHGMFSYYLMKKLQETKGDVTFGDLYDYVKTQVSRKSVVLNSKLQTPSITYSYALTNSWRNKKF